MVRTSELLGPPPPGQAAVEVQVRPLDQIGRCVLNPQSLIFSDSKELSTTQKASTTETGGGGVFPRSLAGSAAATRAPSRAALVSFCLRVIALLKSKIPTTNKTSKGSDTANSAIWEARSSPKPRQSAANARIRRGKGFITASPTASAPVREG